MKSILGELFDGEIYPSERICPDDKEYKDLTDKIIEEMDYFDTLIPEKDAERFDELFSLHMEETSIMSKEAFIYGYQLATVIMIEVLTGKNKLMRK